MKNVLSLLPVLCVASLVATEPACDLVPSAKLIQTLKFTCIFHQQKISPIKRFMMETAQAYLRAPAAQALSNVQQELETLA